MSKKNTQQENSKIKNSKRESRGAKLLWQSPEAEPLVGFGARPQLKKIILTFFLLALAYMPSTEGAALDAYRAMLQSGSYTIRYENITPPPRVTNRDRVDLFGKNTMAVEQNDYLLHRPRQGFITADGGDRYEEVGYADFNMCRLTKGGETYLFTRYEQKGKTVYYGLSEGKVAPVKQNYLAQLVTGESFGDEDMTLLLSAILPSKDRSGSTPAFSLVKEGTLDSGLTYADYKATDNSAVIRYYLQGGKLTKIAAAFQEKTAEGQRGRKCIIRVGEFSPTAESGYLRLPTGLNAVAAKE